MYVIEKQNSLRDWPWMVAYDVQQVREGEANLTLARFSKHTDAELWLLLREQQDEVNRAIANG